jgi:hypothetical protein
MQSIWFLGRFHVLILHLPLGILTLAVALEVLVRFRRFRFLESALAPAWIAGAISALATVALGLMHATEESFDDIPAVEAHGLAGMTLAAGDTRHDQRPGELGAQHPAAEPQAHRRH